MGKTAPELGATGAEMLVPQQEMDAGTQDIGRGQGTLRALAHALLGVPTPGNGQVHPGYCTVARALLGERTRSNGELGPCQ